MSRKAMIMQYAAVACGMAGLFLGMGGEGNVQTGGEFSGSLFAAAMILLLSALALGRMSFVVNDWEKAAAQDPQGPEGHREAQREAEGGLTMFHTTVKCVDCGTVMVDVPSNTKRCAACRVGHNRESVRKANEAERARSAAEAAQPKPRNLDDDLEALKKYNKQRRAAGFEPLSYGVWRSRGAPEEYA